MTRTRRQHHQSYSYIIHDQGRTNFFPTTLRNQPLILNDQIFIPTMRRWFYHPCAHHHRHHPSSTSILSSSSWNLSSSSSWYDAIVVGLGGVGSFALRGLARHGTGGHFLGLEQYRVCPEDNSSGSSNYSNPHGSSHGKSRIYRQAYFEHPNYIPWLRYSVSEFHVLQDQYLQQQQQTKLENKTNKNHHHPRNNDDSINNCKSPLLQECGTLIMEPCSSAQYCQASLKSAKQHDISVEQLNDSDLRERFPQFNYDNVGEPMTGIYEPNGGFVRPEKVLEAALLEAQQQPQPRTTTGDLGIGGKVEIWQEATVLSWTYLPETTTSQGKPLMEVHIEQKTTTTASTTTTVLEEEDAEQKQEEENVVVETHVVTTPCLLVAAGAWTGHLLPTWAPYLKPHRQLQGWIDETSPANNNSDNDDNLFGFAHMPTCVMVTPSYPLHIYGVPADMASEDGNNSCGVKVGIHGRTDFIANPSQNNSKMVSPTERQELNHAAQASVHPSAWRRHHNKTKKMTTMTTSTAASNGVSAASGDCSVHNIVPCMYTMTPDWHFLIGSPHPGVFAIAGLSGHGFKQVPALGQMMVHHALGMNLVEQQDLSLSDWEFCSPTRFNIPDEYGK